MAHFVRQFETYNTNPDLLKQAPSGQQQYDAANANTFTHKSIPSPFIQTNRHPVEGSVVNAVFVATSDCIIGLPGMPVKLTAKSNDTSYSDGNGFQAIEYFVTPITSATDVIFGYLQLNANIGIAYFGDSDVSVVRAPKAGWVAADDNTGCLPAIGDEVVIGNSIIAGKAGFLSAAKSSAYAGRQIFGRCVGTTTINSQKYACIDFCNTVNKLSLSI